LGERVAGALSELRPLTLHVADLPGQWAQMDDAAVPADELTKGPPCGLVSDGFAAIREGWSSWMTYELQPDGREHGGVVSSAFRSTTASAVEALRIYYESEEYSRCLATQAETDLRSSFPRGSNGVVDGSTVERRAADVGVAANLYVVTTKYHYPDASGQRTQLTWHLFEGEHMAALHVHYCTCAPFPAEQAVAWAKDLGQRLKVVPATAA
jgi:hypothetical protein